MPFNPRFFFGTSTALLTGLAGLSSMISPAMGMPGEFSVQSCKPKLARTHACLEDMPLYSYSLALSSDYSGELCVGLGDWEGENAVAIEWDGLHSRLQLVGSRGVNQLLQPERREGRSSGIVIYSDQPVMPQLMEHGCGKAATSDQVTLVDWPHDVAEEPIPAQTAMTAGEQGL